MEITVGFAHSPREVVFHSDSNAEEVATIFASDQDYKTLTDAKGQTYVFRSRAISYVKIGSGTTHPVGFSQ